MLCSKYYFQAKKILIATMMLALSGCYSSYTQEKKDLTPVSHQRYSCFLQFNGRFIEKYKDISNGHPVLIEVQLDVDRYIDLQPGSASAGLFLEFPSTAKISLTPNGEPTVEFTISKVQTQDDISDDKVIVYGDINITNQQMGGVSQYVAPIIHFTSPSSNTMNSDAIPTDENVWNLFTLNYLYVAHPSKPGVFTNAIEFPQISNGISATNCALL